MKDYYKILEISKTASPDDIKKAYRKLAFLYHPDRNSDVFAAQKMKEINEAYDILGDEAKRQTYNYKLDNRFTYQTVNRTNTYTRRQGRPNTGTTQRTYSRRRGEQYDLSAWAGMAKFVSGFIILYCGLLVLDYFFSQSYKKIRVNHLTAFVRGEGKAKEEYKIYEVECDELDFSLNSFYFIHPGDTLSLKITPFFGIVKECEKHMNGYNYELELRTIYSPMFFIVLLSFIISLVAVISNSHQQTVSCTIASVFFFVIALRMMY